ncbi:NAD(P)-dependent oxidoreductase [Solemya velesiana gill symbiont]|uniref:Hydroxyacid dehydrogenase n=1 Tax=Solemya velesiana gill symbiont TaxID=1918948 RepID=A0A1T2KYQ6_9GAMM|nr:NAD(P)-dependent oxidoreductase [Solemya velesiana gill symbiont]OOZ37856.1 hydroxyacid dehydrogenase [Solemya velesiana gill symbiont]
MKIAQLGLGLMGIPIALRLQQQGFDITGWNRGGEQLERAAEQGLAVSRDLAAAVGAADLLVLTLSDKKAIEGVLFSTGSKLSLAGKRVLQMGTIGLAESREIAARCEAAGARYLEAPVLGSIPEAKAGTLIIMAGGDAADYDACLPLLEALGQAPERVGAVGQGAALKLAMNQLIASLTTGFSLSLGLVRSEGLDVERFMALLRTSALYAPTFDKKLGKMMTHDYANPNFPLKHLIKDVDLFTRVARECGIDPSVPEALSAQLEKGRDMGLADEDYSALCESVNPQRD